jgi:hypothetical protein
MSTEYPVPIYGLRRTFVLFSETQVREIVDFSSYSNRQNDLMFYDYDLTDPNDPIMVSIGAPCITPWNEGWGKDYHGTFSRDSISPNVAVGSNSDRNKHSFLKGFAEAKECFKKRNMLSKSQKFFSGL